MYERWFGDGWTGMRFIWVYVAIYFALLAGAVAALWQGGVLARLSPLWTAFTLVFVVGLGLLLAAVWKWQPRSSHE